MKKNYGGLKLYIKNKIKNTSLMTGQKRILLTKNNAVLLFCQNRKLNSPFKEHNRYFHQRIRAKNRIGPHNSDVMSVLVGSMLGDGYCSYRTGEGVRFCFRQSCKHKEYLFMLYEFFLSRGYCSKLEPREYKRTLRNSDKIYKGYEFNLYLFNSLKFLYALFYKNGKKIVPLNLKDLITPLALAVWISDHGGWTNAGVRIATNQFSLDEVNYLAKILKSKYNLDVTIQKIYIKDKFSLSTKKNSIARLTSIILPYLDKSMYYKLGL